MTDKFDPAKQRFGMAYTKSNDNTPLYPFTSNDEIAWVVRPSSNGLHRDIPVKFLTRAPQHDLIPASVADQMVEALKGVIRVADRKTTEFDNAKKALAQYQKDRETLATIDSKETK